ncbi:MAG: hypothetical protein MSA54_07250 [Campylobacter sp.]|uniref:Cj0814 family flagellar-dependent secreted protein n=1 Tax=Campylobacter sp. TaxID=205 RepID=UPI002A58CB8D|nr:hypothetical protein [Campylobacter sp.]MCI7501714.1 hypothetical protein [Campylobacter sp.]MDD7091669.1 hypothetical protein [Campylobacteraceae bacterium]MDY5285322.1 hypothetical protein [Campylobacter sp.]
MIQANYQNKANRSFSNIATSALKESSINEAKIKEKVSDTNLATSKYEGYGVDKDGFFTSDFNEAAGIPSDFKIHKDTMKSLVDVAENDTYAIFAKIDIAKTAGNAYKILSQISPDIANSNEQYISKEQIASMPKAYAFDRATLDVKKTYGSTADIRESMSYDDYFYEPTFFEGGLFNNNNGGKEGQSVFINPHGEHYTNKDGSVSKGGLIAGIINSNLRVWDGITTIAGKKEGYDRSMDNASIERLKAMEQITMLNNTTIRYTTLAGARSIPAGTTLMQYSYTDINEYISDINKTGTAPTAEIKKDMIDKMIEHQKQKHLQELHQAFIDAQRQLLDTSI